MIATDLVDTAASHGSRRSSFENWRRWLDRERIAPVVAIAGSRGKTSVLRALESVLCSNGYRVATWTNRGVDIDGEGQRGELGPWGRVLTRLGAGGLDVALQELDWATVQTAGALGTVYPVVAIANLCGNSDACLATPEMLNARKALNRIRASVAPGGRLVLNADDFAASEDGSIEPGDRYLIGVSPDTPVLRRHLLHGGDACWIDDGAVVIRESGQTTRVVGLGEIGWLRDGTIPFAAHNALMATAIARVCGIAPSSIASGLISHDARPESMPGSFNVFDAGAATVVVDRPMPSWFLRTSLRGTTNLGAGRQIRIVGPMTAVTTEDLQEVGRLLGRQNGVIVLHGAWKDDRLLPFRQGVASNEVPPVFVQAADERSAIQHGLRMLRPDDVMLVLAEDAPAAVRLIASRLKRRRMAPREAAGAA